MICTVKGFSIVNKASLTYAKSFDCISKLNIQKVENENTGLKLNIQKIKIMAFGSITSWQIDGETMETVRDFNLETPKSLHVVTSAMKIESS